MDRKKCPVKTGLICLHQAHQLAKRAQLFSEGLRVLSHGQFSPDSGGGGEAEGLLRDDCRELQTEIDQVRVS